MDFLGGIINFLGGSALGALEAFVQFLYALIVQVGLYLAQLVQILSDWVLGALKAVGGFFSHIWNSFFKGIFLHVWNAVKSAQNWLEQRLRPIINFLKKVRAQYDALYLRYIRPLLVMIQHVRQFLQLLRLLHINIAVRLDAVLAQIEGRIAQTFLTIRAALNNAIDLLNVLADPTLLLRKPTLLLSIRRTLPALIRTVTGKPPGYYFPSPRGAQGGAFVPVGSNFNPRDTSMIAPTSSFMGNDDGIGNVPPLDIGFTISTTVVDEADVLDYFNDSLWPDPPCTDPAVCLQAALDILAAVPANV